MNQRLPNRAEAAPEILIELLGRQRFDRLEHPVPRPVVIVEEGPEIVKRHDLGL